MGNAIYNSYLPTSYYTSSGDLAVNQATAQTVATAVQNDAQSLPPAEQSIFLGLVQDSTSLAPGADGGPPANLAASLSRLEQSAGVIASFLNMAQNPAELAAVLIEASYTEEKNTIDEIVDYSTQEMDQAQTAATDDETAAADLENAAVASLVLGVVGSALQIAGGGMQLYGAGKAFDSFSEGLDGASDEGIDVVPPKIDPPPPTGTPPKLDDPADPTDAAEGAGDPANGQPASPPTTEPAPSIGSNEGEGEGDGDFDVKDSDWTRDSINAGHKIWEARAAITAGVGQALNSGAGFGNAMGQANNENNQALAARAKAQQDYDQQQAQFYTQVLSQVESFVDQVEQALNGILSAETSMGQAVGGARATV